MSMTFARAASSVRRLIRLRRPTCSYACISRRSLATISDSSFLNGANSGYIEEMYRTWKSNPDSVHASWAAYFKTGQFQSPPSSSSSVSSSASAGASAGSMSVDAAKVLQLVRAYQVRGHLLANIDPLGLLQPRPDHELLEPSKYGFSDGDMDRHIDLRGLGADVSGFLDRNRSGVTLREITTRLKQTYCGTIGYEYMHMPSVETCNWIRERIETREAIVYSKAAKTQILDRLTWADHFERFLQTKHGTAKRFGLEGAESFIPGMKALIGRSAELGVENVVIGMPHRGRLNVLNNVVRKNTAQILSEFADNQEDDPESGNGDVKYHLGMSLQKKGSNNKIIHLSLVANPSHLEAVDPVVTGKTRAKQYYSNDTDRSKSMALLLHGDAAFAGQGVVYETFGFMDLPEYTTGGTVHIVVNNQVGFTTDPSQGRSSAYCTDIAKAFNLPVFHVNGDDPEAVVHVCELAAEWRARFHKDVVIDVVCYRKHGHNEIDEPEFTQPLMYNKIKSLPTTLKLYQDKLISEGSVTAKEIEEMSNKVKRLLENAFEESKKQTHAPKDWLESNWKGVKSSREYSPPQPTGIPVDTLRFIGERTSTYPKDFTAHSRLASVYKIRQASIAAGKDIDWGTAEALAFGSLLIEGRHVRLSGQDVERGTFSHRHAVLHDQTSNKLYVPMNNIQADQAHLTVTNSHLSEYGVLGFELGYSLETPNSLVCWEAQFGDFFNTAQVIVDQFIASMEDKWLRQSGLVLLLPHGYEGAGPEHSSARIERFLQQVNDHPDVMPDTNHSRQIQQANMQIVNCTTPANYFHVLRRQLHRSFRKPLVVFTPKSLLRNPQAKSAFEEMKEGTTFSRIYSEVDDDIEASAGAVKRLLLCSGRVYYDLFNERKKRALKNVAIVRIEQIAPFPFAAVAEQLALYKSAEVVWCQEEPMNMGAYTYVKDRIQSAAKHINGATITPRYVGRSPSASPSAGHKSQHDRELSALLNTAFGDIEGATPQETAADTTQNKRAKQNK